MMNSPEDSAFDEGHVDPESQELTPREILAQLVESARRQEVIVDVPLLTFEHTWANEGEAEPQTEIISILVHSLVSKIKGTADFLAEMGLPITEDNTSLIANDEEFRMTLTIKSANKQALGVQSGILEVKVSFVFFASAARNEGFQTQDVEEGQQPRHIPYVMTAAICELVAQGVLEEWHSAPYSHHTQHGSKMMRRVEDWAPRYGLEVVMKTEVDGGWVVKKKTS